MDRIGGALKCRVLFRNSERQMKCHESPCRVGDDSL